jgi:lysophospholipase L1-like esterase
LNAKYVAVDGTSYGVNWPLVAFYDSSNNLLYEIHASERTGYENEPVLVPDNAAKCVVNAGNINRARLRLIAYGNKTQYHLNSEMMQEINNLISSTQSIRTNDVVVTRLIELDGSKTTGIPWRIINGQPSTGAYEYVEYSLDTLEIGKVVVSGTSWGPEYPLITFYDSDSIQIGLYGTTGDTDWVDEEVSVPAGAASCVVNGSTKTSRPSATLRSAVIVETQDDVNSRIDGILFDAGLEHKKYLFIGDSYAQGYSHDGSNDGWPVYVAEYLGLNDAEYGMSRRGGAGFAVSGNSFLQLLQSAVGDGYTDIVVCGGFNDRFKTAAQIETAIIEFCDAAKQLYPSARVYVGCIGYIKEGTGESAYSNWQDVRTSIETVIVPAYQKSVKYGCRYLNNVEYTLGESGLTPTDGYHPSEAGNRAIALGIANALLTGSAPLPYNHDMRAQ